MLAGGAVVAAVLLIEHGPARVERDCAGRPLATWTEAPTGPPARSARGVLSVDLSDRRVSALLPGAGRTLDHPALSPDGRRLAALSLQSRLVGGIVLCDLRRDTTTRLRMSVSASDFPLSWNAGGEGLLFLGGDSLGYGADHKPFLVTVASGAARPLAGDAPWYWDGVAPSPGGDRLALLIQWRYPTAGTEPEQLAVVQGDSSRLERVAGSRQVGEIDAFSWSPDGRKIVFTGYRNDDHGDLYVVDLATKRVAKLLATGAGQRHPAWSPDGTRIAYEHSPAARALDTSIWVLDLRTGARHRVTFGNRDVEPAWSPDGRRIVFVRRG